MILLTGGRGGVCSQGGVCSGGCLLRGGVCSRGGSTPGGVSALGGVGGDPPRMATAAGGTHPTGMYSCSCLQII